MSVTPSPSTPAFGAVGLLFTDVVYAALPHAPRLGEELWTDTFAWGAGGIANQTIAAARLGVRSRIAAGIGDDEFGALCRRALERDGIDTAGLRTVADWSTPVTVALSYAGDRALVTGGTLCPTPLGELAPALASPAVASASIDETLIDWVRTSASRGTRVFADLGWDPSGSWDVSDLDALDGAYAFVPNDVEALAYTRTDDVTVAARLLAERVPLAVITLGGAGIAAVDAETGEEVRVPAVPVSAVDTTGAGDVFGAALAVASLTALPLATRIDFAALVAAITVSRPGGAATAPTRHELLPWLDARHDIHPRYRDVVGDVTAALEPFLPTPTERTR